MCVFKYICNCSCIYVSHVADSTCDHFLVYFPPLCFSLSFSLSQTKSKSSSPPSVLLLVTYAFHYNVKDCVEEKNYWKAQWSLWYCLHCGCFGAILYNCTRCSLRVKTGWKVGGPIPGCSSLPAKYLWPRYCQLVSNKFTLTQKMNTEMWRYLFTFIQLQQFLIYLCFLSKNREKQDIIRL